MILFDKIAVLGAGLLGGSLAWALKSRGLCKETDIWSRSQSTRDNCKGKPWADRVCDTLEEAVQNADFIAICSTASSIPIIAKEAAKYAKKSALITDVGSTKLNISDICLEIFKNGNFVPSHPMAGSEKSGADFADKDLFKNAACFVCPTSNKYATEKIAAMWREIGMNVHFVSPQEHDRIAAEISHIPQCVASTLANFASKDFSSYKTFAGNGFRDTTRIAKSDVQMWKSILKENAANISNGLDEIIGMLETLSRAVKIGDEKFIEEFLKNAKKMRSELDK